MRSKSINTQVLRHRLGTLALGALFIAVVVALAGAEAEKPAAANRYVGSDTCKNCHSQKEKGDPHGAWKASKHAQAFTVLGSDKAKEVGKKEGVTNPQTDAKCIACHETGYGLPKENFAKSFVDKQGVQCETCHGPGEKHKDARMKAADENKGGDEGFGFEEGGDKPAAAAVTKIPEGEIFTPKDEATCVKCHNDKSPSFPGKFDFAEMSKKIQHKDPRKQAPAPK